jgi:uncharacterized membrane protein
MKLSETGEARVRGYLFVLGQSLKSSLPRDTALDAVLEIESHLRERLDQAEAMPNEKAALERVLAELGPPLRVAQAYSAEMAVDEAIATGGLGAVGGALWRLATTTVSGFAAALALLTGYVVGLALLFMPLLKMLFPANVGLLVVNGVPHGYGALFPLPPGAEVRGGFLFAWLAFAVGLGVLVGTHRGARAFLAWWKARLPGFRGADGPAPS